MGTGASATGGTWEAALHELAGLLKGRDVPTDRTRGRIRAGVTLSALCFAIIGAMLLFAPNEVTGVLPPAADGQVLVQLLGAALLGFGAMNWIARGAALGVSTVGHSSWAIKRT